MGSRSTTFVRMMRSALLPFALVAALGAGAFATAGPAHAAPTTGPSAPMPSLRALLAVQQAQLTASDGAGMDYFGCSVAVSGDTAVVGAYSDTIGANTDQGSAYVFVRSGTTWSQQAKLIATDGNGGDFFGHSVAVDGDTAVVGAILDDVGANADQGSAYVFVRSGTTWSQQQKLTASDGAAWDYFGRSVALSRDTAVVGAYYGDVGANADQGSAYAFARSGTTWSQQQKLTAADGAAGDNFGCSVAVSGNTAVVGADQHTVGTNAGQGSAYVFVRNDATWSRQQQLTPSDGASEDVFGYSVAVSGDSAVVGAIRDDIGATADQGSAYVFTRSGTTWSRRAKLTAADGAAGDRFGYAVALSGGTAVVGAVNDNVGANSGQGSAYVFTPSGTTWSQQAQLTVADGAAADHFGISLAVSGDTAVVGASFDDVGASTDQGSTFVFTGVMDKPGRPVARSPKGLISSRTPTFRWTAAAGAVTYQVRVYRGSKVIRSKAGITKLSWKCTRRLPRGVWLRWRVRAVNEVGAGPWSARPRIRVR